MRREEDWLQENILSFDDSGGGVRLPPPDLRPIEVTPPSAEETIQHDTPLQSAPIAQDSADAARAGGGVRLPPPALLPIVGHADGPVMPDSTIRARDRPQDAFDGALQAQAMLATTEASDERPIDQPALEAPSAGSTEVPTRRRPADAMAKRTDKPTGSVRPPSKEPSLEEGWEGGGGAPTIRGGLIL